MILPYVYVPEFVTAYTLEELSALSSGFEFKPNNNYQVTIVTPGGNGGPGGSKWGLYNGAGGGSGANGASVAYFVNIGAAYYTQNYRLRCLCSHEADDSWTVTLQQTDPNGIIKLATLLTDSKVMQDRRNGKAGGNATISGAGVNKRNGGTAYIDSTPYLLERERLDVTTLENAAIRHHVPQRGCTVISSYGENGLTGSDGSAGGYGASAPVPRNTTAHVDMPGLKPAGPNQNGFYTTKAPGIFGRAGGGGSGRGSGTGTPGKGAPGGVVFEIMHRLPKFYLGDKSVANVLLNDMPVDILK